jgi:hypothetical protein
LLFLGDNATTWRDAAGRDHEVVVCANNNDYAICNWLVPAAAISLCAWRAGITARSRI